MLRLAENERGFSLIEMLIAITLLSIALLGVASLQTVAVNKGAFSYKILAANYLAREAMEDIMSWDITTPSLNSSTAATAYLSPAGGTTFTVEGGGTFAVTYKTATDTPVVGTTQIEVTVSDTAKRIHDITITSFKKVTS